MNLRRIKIANFRGIRELVVDLEQQTTVLIGENNNGKTSTLDAMRICLGMETLGENFDFAPTDFYAAADDTFRSGSPPIEITLTFRERNRDGWDEPHMEPLKDAMVTDGGGLREIRMCVVARQSLDMEKITIGCRFLDHSGRPIEVAEVRKKVKAIRSLSPFILISPDRYRNGQPDAGLHLFTRGVDVQRWELERQVEDVYHKITEARGPVSRTQVSKGLNAVADLINCLLERRDERLGPRPMLEELSTLLRKQSGANTRTKGAGVQNVGILILLGALLEARGTKELPAHAVAIVGIEEPETHLHPLMLASIWQVINCIRAQKLVTTNSGDLLADVPLRSLRRLVRRRETVKVYRLKNKRLSQNERRRVGYHIRARRGEALFARCWLLVEGETEYWLLPELARLMGYDFATEGISCIEFAQCGVDPLIKLASNLGIEWHLIIDGDDAGEHYARHARQLIRHRSLADRITTLDEWDMEQCLWAHGYEEVYRRNASQHRKGKSGSGAESPAAVIKQAIRARSKPGLALAIAEAAGQPDSPGVPRLLEKAVETTIRLARESCA